MGSLFYFSEYTFGAVPISMFFVSEIEAEAVEGASEVVPAIDQERRLLDLLLVLGLVKKQQRELGYSRLKQPTMQDFIRRGIDRRVQPVALVIHSNHRLVKRDVIRFGVAAGLYVGFLHPVVNRRPTAFDTQFVEYLFCICK
jgi:hypothetical protein